MEKLEKIIRGLECCATNRRRREDCEAIKCTYLDLEKHGCIHQLIRDALALLKAQEPVEPTEPDEDKTRYCGDCGSPVGYEVLGAPGLDYIQYNYCPICGRPVKWE